MPVKKRDPNDPTFPHGSKTGYEAGCHADFPCPSTPTCTQHKAAVWRSLKDRRNSGIARRYKAKAVREYVQKRIDQGWTVHAYATAAGMHPDSLMTILKGGRKTVMARTAIALMRVTDEDLIKASTGTLPTYLIRWKIGSLCANGLSMEEQAKKLGHNVDTLFDIVSGRTSRVTREVFENIETLFEMVKDVPGTNKRSRAFAARHGFDTPDKYDSTGLRLDQVEERDEAAEKRWASRDRAATRRLETLWLSMMERLSAQEIGARLGIHPREITEFRAEANLRFLKEDDGDVVIAPGQEERARDIRAVLIEWKANPLDDPYLYATRLGMMPGRNWIHVEFAGKARLRAA